MVASALRAGMIKHSNVLPPLERCCIGCDVDGWPPRMCSAVFTMMLCPLPRLSACGCPLMGPRVSVSQDLVDSAVGRHAVTRRSRRLMSSCQCNARDRGWASGCGTPPLHAARRHPQGRLTAFPGINQARPRRTARAKGVLVISSRPLLPSAGTSADPLRLGLNHRTLEASPPLGPEHLTAPKTA